MSDYICELCHKKISQQEATDSSVMIRMLFGQGSDVDIELLSECYNHDFCADCAKTFTSGKDFAKFIKAYNDSVYVFTKRG
jgi:hypothetical protein